METVRREKKGEEDVGTWVGSSASVNRGGCRKGGVRAECGDSRVTTGSLGPEVIRRP